MWLEKEREEEERESIAIDLPLFRIAFEVTSPFSL